MTAPTRQTMRLLSPRLQTVRSSVSTSSCQWRLLSTRYSDPARHASAARSWASSLGVEAKESTSGPQNPYVNTINPWEEERAYYARRTRFALIGLTGCIVGIAVVCWRINVEAEKNQQRLREQQKHGSYQMEAPEDGNLKFQGKEVHVVGAGDGKRIVAQGPNGDELELVETGTSYVPHFPRTIELPCSPDQGVNGPQEGYTLIGLGIRTVFYFQVYVVGMYIRTEDISALQSKLIRIVNENASTLIPAEKEQLEKRLLDPVESRQIWMELLKTPGIKTAFRITPTRSTDFSHLRDGFVTSINARKAEARSEVQGQETEYDSEDFGQAIQKLKSIFTGRKAPKGSVLILNRDDNGALNVMYQPKWDKQERPVEYMGTVPDQRVSRLIWLGYLAGSKVSSPSARDGIVSGCSIETMVM
ncbi:chalcone isomerase [Piedraia hortae CBS 480.64]|uniref:Chalcone isomerase n=1 Tax=Piedraia hortae CBS 480.64 TaxID=1314780 RepID=A0A6A7BZR0_9PEZI|nr:chalcone isomerase [Piedraia hortae CBS 480.64]